MKFPSSRIAFLVKIIYMMCKNEMTKKLQSHITHDKPMSWMKHFHETNGFRMATGVYSVYWMSYENQKDKKKNLKHTSNKIIFINKKLVPLIRRNHKKKVKKAITWVYNIQIPFTKTAVEYEVCPALLEASHV